MVRRSRAIRITNNPIKPQATSPLRERKIKILCKMLIEKDGWDQGLDPTTQYVRTQEEFVPYDDTNQILPTYEGIINLDINDRNVMLSAVAEEDLLEQGDDSEHSHEEVPVFKIGDLGVVRAFRGFHRDNMLALASTRVLGNQWCNTPEQFTQTWNYYGAAASDIDALNMDNTAGKYDWWTNLWQVARLMMIIVGTAYTLIMWSISCEHHPKRNFVHRQAILPWPDFLHPYACSPSSLHCVKQQSSYS